MANALSSHQSDHIRFPTPISPDTMAGIAGLPAWLHGWRPLMAAPAKKDEPSGQMTWAIHVTIAPVWF